jgi:hypothetical protein
MVITNNGKVAIGTASTSSKLHVFGDFRLEDGTQMDGYFLKSDANGVASWSPVEGDIAGITAGAGLTGGGSSGYVVTLDAQVNNGLSITSDYIGLGGTLSSSTIIDISTNNIQFNSNTQSGLLTLDGTNKRVGVLTDDPFNDQVAYAGDSDYASNFVLRTETQNYGLNHNDGTAEFNTYIDPSFFGVGVMFGSTTNHGVGIYTNDYNRIWIDGGDNITGGNVQIGNNAPTFTYKLEVSGTVSTTGFRMTDGASDGYFLKSDANGVASWSPVEGDIAGITAGAGLTGGGSSGYVLL